MTGRARRALLRDVSRSFYLSIRLLPGGIREPVSLAYLLARFADTLADNDSLSREEKGEVLRPFAAWLGPSDRALPDEWLDLVRRLASDHAHPGERLLLENFPRLAEWEAAAEEKFRPAIASVLQDIVAGMTLDLERFEGRTESVTFLDRNEDLDHYTFLVAGTVGRFWSRTGYLDDPRFSRLPPEELEAKGIAYGQGLQLINILRDLGRDGRQGRCYFPRDSFPPATAQRVQTGDFEEDLRPCLTAWSAKCEEGLRTGAEYASTLRRFRCRLAAAIPALVGVRTLRLWQAAPWSDVLKGVKIERREMGSIVRRAAIASARPDGLRKVYGKLESAATSPRHAV